MLPEGEDLNEWIAVNSKSYEKAVHPCVEVKWEEYKCLGFILKRKQTNKQN